MEKEINGFIPPDNHYLSPYYMRSPIVVDGITYNSVQQAFFAHCTDIYKEKIILSEITLGSELRRFGESLLRSYHTPMWQIEMMKILTRKKFTLHPSLGEALKKTGHRTVLKNILIYDDRFWGIYQGLGENHIGKIDMEIRSELFAENLVA